MQLSCKPGLIAISGVMLIFITLLLAIGGAIYYKSELMLIAGFGSIYTIFPLSVGLDFYLIDQSIAK